MDDQEDLTAYLEPTEAVDSADSVVVALARDLAGSLADPAQKARRLFEHAREAIRYDPFSPFFLMEHYRAGAIIARGGGYCVQKAVVLAALARAAGIPAKLTFADIVNHLVRGRIVEIIGTNLFVYHGYVEVRLGGRWVKLAPTFERSLCEQMGYPLVEFDGVHDAVHPPTDAKSRPFVEYVRHHGSFADVPLRMLLDAWAAAYGEGNLDAWRRALGG